jgi:hypothetical protein
MLGEGGTALSKLKDAALELKARKDRRALAKLEKASREFQALKDRPVDLKGLSEVIDGLKYELFFQEWTSQNRGVGAVGRLERDRS